ncbi:MAG: leucine-rich repeat protein [Bacteroidaceae bacterium]|nr:leucine-rich repeat protein [Bacteroidaceae bacterium]
MKKNILKSACLCIAICMPLFMLSCSNEEKLIAEQEPIAVIAGEGEVKGISVTLTDFQVVSTDTRTAYTDSEPGMNVTWAKGDTIGIFPNKGGQVEFPIEEGTQSKQAQFDGGGWALKANNTYAAYYPYNAKNAYYHNQAIQIDYSGQTQAGNNNTEHLSQYDYQATAPVNTNANGYLNFQFKHLGALLKFQLTVPKAGTYTSLTLTSSEKIFVTKAELDISGSEPLLKPVKTSNSLSLNLDNVELASDNAVLTAYMMVAPTDFSQGSLELMIDGDEVFITTLTGHQLEAGKQYPINKALESGNIVFADTNAKAICIQYFDTNGDGELSYAEAKAVTSIPTVKNQYGESHSVFASSFYIQFSAREISTFNELQYFKSLADIPSGMFRGQNISEVTLPESIVSIGGLAFSGCPNLRSIIIPETVTNIGYYAFTGCVSLDNVIIPNSVTAIGKEAFENCSGMKSVRVSEGITSIEYATFKGCSSLTFIEIPQGVTSIGNNAFNGCRKLDFVSIPESVTSIGDMAFQNCNALTNIALPKHLTSIGSFAFMYCNNLTDIAIPDGVTSIASSAFAGCSSLAEIEIPNQVTSIGASAFSDCSNLTKIVIPGSVTSIGDYVFSGCVKLTSITCMAVNPPACQMIYGADRYTGAIYVPATSVDAYKAAEGWKEYASQIQAIPE